MAPDEKTLKPAVSPPIDSGPEITVQAPGHADHSKLIGDSFWSQMGPESGVGNWTTLSGPKSGYLDMGTGKVQRVAAVNTDATTPTTDGTDNTQPANAQPDAGWDALLKNAKIDRSKSDKTDGEGHELLERKTDEVDTIQVRKGHKEGDPPANYVIDKDGNVHEMIPPDKKAMGEGDTAIVIEFDESGTRAAESANAAQIAAANEMIGQIQRDCAHAGVAPDIPPDILSMLTPKDVPPPQPVVRGGGGMRGGGGSSGGGNGGMYGGGGYESPGVGNRGGAPSRAPRGGGPDVPGMVKPGKVDMSHFDVSHMKIPENLKPVVSKIVGMISKNEGSPTSINWNDNGYGVSVGMFQANQKAGELPTLLRKMHDDDPAKFNQVFGPYADKMLNEGFVRGASITKGSDLGNRMQQALNEPVFQQTQLNMIGEKVVRCAEIVKQKTGVVPSEAMVALFTDAVNQLGEGGAGKYLRQGMSDYHELDQKLRAGSHWRASRNPQVIGQIAANNLSDNPGSFNV